MGIKEGEAPALTPDQEAKIKAYKELRDGVKQWDSNIAPYYRAMGKFSRYVVANNFPQFDQDQIASVRKHLESAFKTLDGWYDKRNADVSDIEQAWNLPAGSLKE
jgi:hypothetical protein